MTIEMRHLIILLHIKIIISPIIRFVMSYLVNIHIFICDTVISLFIHSSNLKNNRYYSTYTSYDYNYEWDREIYREI